MQNITIKIITNEPKLYYSENKASSNQTTVQKKLGDRFLLYKLKKNIETVDNFHAVKLKYMKN